MKSAARRKVWFLPLGVAMIVCVASTIRASPRDTHLSVPPALYRSMEYRLVGPYRGGRVVAVTGVPCDPYLYYMGSTGGGVWKTTDGGEIWSSISDGFFTSGSIGAIAVAESDPNVIYVGTGEACIRGNVSPGDGVYKSTDAGATWKQVGLRDAGQIPRVRIHPRESDVVYVAALGHAFGRNSERGVFRSKDGGKTWERVLYVSDKAGAADLVMDQTNPRILYAAIWEAVRKPWTLISGGEDSGLYKTTNSGDTWTQLTDGLPTGIMGRIGVTVSPAKPDRVWAIIEAEEGGVYRSDDGGKSFSRVNDDRRLLGRPFYYMHIYADPLDPEKVYSMGHGDGFFRSLDGGKTFDNSIRAPHGDYHDLWLNPQDSSIMINGGDGGASVSYNGGLTWSTVMNQPTAEIYRVATDTQFLYRLYGAQQDNTTISIPSRTTDNGILERHWYPVGGCEQGHIAVDPRNPNIVYSGCYEGIIERYDHTSGQARNILAYPQFGEGVPAKHLKYRFQMNAPIRLSPHDPSILYHTSHVVHRSTNEGQSWEVISPDLTRDDESKQDYSGGPITRDHTGPETYCTIFAFEESPVTAGLLWAGSDDGLVHLSHDGGKRWDDVTPEEMPEWGTVNMIDPSVHDPGRAFIAVHRYRDDDFRPYIFRTSDYGKTWTRLTSGNNGIPDNHFVRVVREDPVQKGLLYAGTEFGIYVSFDDGAAWQSLQLNLPVVPITDMQVKDNDLVIATQGRSFWILDDLSPLRQMTPDVVSASLHLFQPGTAYRVQGSSVERPRIGKNPPNGVLVYYLLAEAPSQALTMEFLDASGKLIRQFTSQPEDALDPTLTTEQGMNRFVWDMRYPSARIIEGVIVAGDTRGPKVVPGAYQVRMTVGDWTETRPLEIKKDPRLATTPEDFQAQFDLATTILNQVTRIHEAVRAIRDVRRQTEEWLKKPGLQDDIVTSGERLLNRLASIEGQLIEPRLQAPADLVHFEPCLDSHFIDLYNVVLTADAKPTAGAELRYADLKVELDTQMEELQGIFRQEINAFNRKLTEKSIPPVSVPKNGNTPIFR